MNTNKNCIENIINFKLNPLNNKSFITSCRQTLNRDGILILQKFITQIILDQLVAEAQEQSENAFFTKTSHNVYLTDPDPKLGKDHIYNHQIFSTKGCIAADQIPPRSSLKLLYNSVMFQKFVADVLGEKKLFEYADNLSSINVHFAKSGQELGWHFDNSSFAISLLLQAPKEGGIFEYVPDLRNITDNNMNFAQVADVINETTVPVQANMTPGTLMLFRGNNTLHRVTPVLGRRTRILAVFAYNKEPGVTLSETARMNFFGRIT